MKVICISLPTVAENMPGYKVPKIEIGDILEVVDMDDWKGEKCFYFEKYGPLVAFAARLFAPLNGPDERERLEAWQAGHLTQEDKMIQALAETMPEVEMPQDSFERVWENIKATL